MPRGNESRRIALGGIFAGMAVVLMLLGGVLPFATFLAPALAGICLIPAAVEFGLKTGVLLYCAVSLLSIFMVPDKEMALIFIFLLGYYPLAKAKLDKICARVVQWSTKFALFNVSVLAMYSLILFLFPIEAVVQEFEAQGIPMTAVLLILGNVTFVIYDTALSRVIGLYLHRFRGRIMNLR